MTNNAKACVFLLQLGGPETLNDIQPFLTNLFEDVFPLPKFLRRPLARWIAKKRTPKVTPLYAAMGGGSPLRRNTDAQAHALEQKLAELGIPARVFVCMRYAPPRSSTALAEAREHCGNVPWVVLPLYPQYSFATTRSSREEFDALLLADEKSRLHYVDSYEASPKYLDSMAARIADSLEQLSSEQRKNIHVLFSAHGLPMSLVRQGDPYPAHIQSTLEGIVTRLQLTNYSLAFQSRVGPVKWLEPSTDHAIQDLGKKGVTQVLVVPISFVSEHIETLQELDVELRHTAEKSGISLYARVPTVGTDPGFIDALAEEVQKALRT